MYQMIAEYERSRAALEARSHEIAERLRNPELLTKEREQLARRRELLNYERVDLLHAIREMRAHMQETEGADGKKDRYSCR